ncbi:MAG: hypothetical protein GX496_11035 [Firmicutes bacterium]|nr:hypothetical protein [Bacillota bacterium]
MPSTSPTSNHRATRRLLDATNVVAATFGRRPRPRPAAHLPPGTPIVYHFARSTEAEADWVAARLLRLQAEQARASQPLRWRDVGVLVRPNHRAQTIAQALERAGIPHLTVETCEFFRRQEVKDAVAYLRLLVNPADGHALARVL